MYSDSDSEIFTSEDKISTLQFQRIDSLKSLPEKMANMCTLSTLHFFSETIYLASVGNKVLVHTVKSEGAQLQLLASMDITK